MHVFVVITRAGFLNLNAVDILVWIILHCEGLSHVLLEYLTTPGLHLPDARVIPPVVTTKEISRHCQMFPSGSGRMDTDCRTKLPG